MLENLLADDNWIDNVSIINNNSYDNNEDNILLNSDDQIQEISGMYLLYYYVRKKMY